MAKQTINVGTGPNTGTADSIRVAFEKVNANFTELYTGTVLNLSAVNQHIIPAVTDTYDLGSPTKQWRSLYVKGGTVYFDNVPLTVTNDGTIVVNGEVAATPGGSTTWSSITGKPTFATVATSGSYDDLTDKPTIPSITGLATETFVTNAIDAIPAVDLTGYALTSEIPDVSNFITAEDIPAIPADISDLTDTQGLLVGGSGSITVSDGASTSVSNVTELLINGTITEIEPGIVGISVTGEGLPSITIPATPVILYKGLQASYGVVHSNSNSSELNVNKIVIHKPATTTSTIDPSGNQDDFQVSGLGSSDVLAMFVIYGDINGAKSLSTLQNFARAVINNVILVDGVADNFRTVDQMKTAFYGNYQILASAAGGLYTNFQFFANNINTLTGGATTVREGSGATFDILNNGSGGYVVLNAYDGTDYLTGHRVKILGTDLGGVTPDNDLIVEITAALGVPVSGTVVSGTAPGTSVDQYLGVTGTNIDVGSGLAVSSIFKNNNVFEPSLSSPGNNYVVGDVITLLGSELEGGTSPANDITLTVTNVGNIRGPAFGVTLSGTPPQLWPSNNISDGGEDQYDTANYINTNLANQINYNGGNTVVDGTLAFGAGSTYSFVYDTAIFGLFVTGNGATSISTSGNSGADGSSTTETGYMFGGGTAAETFDNAVTHINLVGDPYIGEAVSFTKTDYGDEVDILIEDDGEGAGVGITRSNQNGIYNPYREGSWDSDVSPGGTLWNIAGWADLTDVETRTYVPFYEAFGFGGLGNKVINTECVMYLPDNGKYYTVKFTQWTQGINGQEQGGGFAYTRRELDLTNLQEGIRFADGTKQKTAYVPTTVKLRSPGNRRIEEIYGYKSVSVTEKQTVNITAIASRNAADEFRFWIDTTTTNIDDILNNTSVNGIWDTTTIEFSLDNVTWYRYDFNSTGAGNEIGYGVILPSGSLNYSQGDNIYFRYKVGGEPQIWWDRNELPGSGTNFRGAIIDYHAYDTDSGTMIGTIHIARDSGDEFITHTEVFSGGTDGENIDLWLQTTEGQLKYRRLDGESSTLKVQWSAKVFYGSEYWD